MDGDLAESGGDLAPDLFSKRANVEALADGDPAESGGEVSAGWHGKQASFTAVADGDGVRRRPGGRIAWAAGEFHG